MHDKKIQMRKKIKINTKNNKDQNQCRCCSNRTKNDVESKKGET